MSWSTRACLMIVAALAMGPRLPLATAAESLASLVPDDAGLCVLAEDVAPHIDNFLSGPFAARLNGFPPLAGWSAKNRPALEQLSAEVGRQLGVEPQDVWRQVFGHRLALAVWPQADAVPGDTARADTAATGAAQAEGPGLLLVESRDAVLLQRLVDGLCEAQLRAGEVVEARVATHAGRSYRARVIRRGGVESKIYLALLGPIGVLSNDESIVRRVLELHAVESSARTGLAAAPLFRQAREQVDAQAPLSVFVNSRAWDATIAAEQDQSGTASKPEAQLVRHVWKSSLYWAFSLRLTPRPTLLARVQFEPLPPSSLLRRGLESVAGPATFLQRVPNDCLAAAAGSFDIGRMLQLARGDAPTARPAGADDGPQRHGPTLPTATGQRRGVAAMLSLVWNMLDDAFQGLGPSFGGYVAAAADPERPIPADFVVGIEIQNRSGNGQAAKSSRELHGRLRNLLELAVALDDRPADETGPQLRSTDEGGLPISEITGWEAMPLGWRPTLAVVPRLLLVGTSRAALEGSGRLASKESLASSAVLAALLAPAVRDPSHLAYVNLAATRAWVTAHREALSAAVAGHKGAESAAADRGLEQLLSVLSLADAAVVAAKVRVDGVTVCIALAAGDNEVGTPPSR